MVNFGLNSAAILGIFLALSGAALYFLRSIRPELSRDQDIFFAAVGLLCGGILLTNGWRLDPILQFGQFLLAGSTIFFAYEAIRLRGIATEQAKRNTRIVDDERPVSNAYRYEQDAEPYDQLESEEDRYSKRRLRGSEDPRYSRADKYEGETRRPKSRGTSERMTPGDRPPKRRPRPTSRPSERPVESWEADLESDWDDKPSSTTRPRPTRPPSRDPESVSKPRRRRSPDDRISPPPVQDEETTPSDYVDYQPIDPSEYEPKKPSEEDEDRDSSSRFDY